MNSKRRDIVVSSCRLESYKPINAEEDETLISVATKQKNTKQTLKT